MAMALSLLGAAGCGDPSDGSPGLIDEDQPSVSGTCVPSGAPSDPFVDCVDSFIPGPSAAFGHDLLPQTVQGPPVPGATANAGSLDVAALGCGGVITLMFDGEGLQDREGPDLLVFENAFATGDTTFAEPARVLVSDDGETWYAFPCTPSGDGEWPPEGCAGVTPTTASTDEDFNPMTAGGDAFDLAAVGLASARWLRLIDVTDTHYGDPMWCGGTAGGFDLDAAAAAIPWPAQRTLDGTDERPRR